MSLKRSFSAVTQELPSYSEEMPSYGKKSRRRSRKVIKVPRAIATRGTPDGYYEIPVHSYTKIFLAGNQGFYNTDQITGAVGALGGAGFGYYTSLDNEYFLLGGFGVYQTITKAVPGFSSIQAVFDNCKISEIRMEYWFTTTNSSATTFEYTAAGDVLRSAGVDLPELWLTEDQNNANPGNNMDDICQYSKLLCVRQNSQSYKMKFRPHIRDDVGTAGDESGTTTTLAAAVPSTYIQTAKPAAAHFGVRGFLNISNTATVAQQGYLHIKTTQIRRYKNSN